MATFSSILQLRSASEGGGPHTVTGYYEHEDWGSSPDNDATFTWDANHGGDHNYGTVIRPYQSTGNGRWIRTVTEDHLLPYWFGVKGNDVEWHDNTPGADSAGNTRRILEWFATSIVLYKEALAPVDIYRFKETWFFNDNKFNGLRYKGTRVTETIGGYDYVNEAQSSVFKRSDLQNGSNGTSHICMRFLFPSGYVPEDMEFDGLVINGNFKDVIENFDIDNPEHQMILYASSGVNSPFDSIRFKNYALYNCGGSAQLYFPRGDSGRNGLIYHFNRHGVGGRDVDVDDMKIHNEDFTQAAGFYAIDCNQGAGKHINVEAKKVTLGMKIPNTTGNVTRGFTVEDTTNAHGFTTGGGANAHEFVWDLMTAIRAARSGFRLGDGTENSRCGRLKAVDCGKGSGGNNRYNFWLTNAVNLQIDNLYSDGYDGLDHGAVFVMGNPDTTIRSGVIRGSIAGNGALVFYQTHDLLRIANIKFEGNSVTDIQHISSGSVTLRYSRFANGAPSTGGNITLVALPVCNNVTTQISGDNLNLAVNAYTDDTDGTEITVEATVRFYYADPDVFPHEFTELGTGSYSDGAWRMTVNNYEEVFEEGKDYAIFAEVTHNGETSIEARDPETGDYDETIFSWGELPEEAPAIPTLSSPADNATGVSVRPELEVESQPNTDTVTFQVATDNNDFDNTGVVEETVSGFSYALTAQQELDNDTEYWWRAYATNEYGSSDPSATRKFTTEAETEQPAASPTNMRPYAELSLVSLNPLLKADPVDNATNYRVIVSLNADMSYPFVDDDTLTTPEYQLENLSEETTHYWRMSAIGGGIERMNPVRWFKTRSLLQKALVIGVESNTDWDVEPDTSTIVVALSDPDNDEYIFVEVESIPIELNLDEVDIVNDKTGGHILVFMRKEAGDVVADVALNEGATERASWDGVEVTEDWQAFALHLTIAEMESITVGNDLRLVIKMVGGS